MELHAKDERAVFVGKDGAEALEVDPKSLAIDGELSESLHEWAKVVGAVQRSDTADAGIVVTQRGKQLAGQVATAMGQPISYVDPLSGEVSVMEPAAPPAPEPEPTPWLTGIGVAVFTAAFVAVAVITLAITLTETSKFLGAASNVVVTAGLLPSVWLARKTLVLRWMAFGTVGGLAVGWLALPFILFA